MLARLKTEINPQVAIVTGLRNTLTFLNMARVDKTIVNCFLLCVLGVLVGKYVLFISIFKMYSRTSVARTPLKP